MKRKCLVIGIILLFIGVAIAPSINFTVVKASNDNDLVEVTTQACGIQGYRDTTVKLTRQQYQNLEQYLVDFRARLNQTTTREEAVPIFKEAVVELDKYGLLPKGMSVERAQRFCLGINQNKILQKKLLQNHLLKLDNNSNLLCLITGRTNKTIFIGIFTKMLWSVSSYIPNPFDDIFDYVIITPLMILNNKLQPFFAISDILMTNAYGQVWTLGLLGVRTWNGTLNGLEPSPYWETNVAALGFTGIKILLNSDSFDNFYLGYAFHVRIE